MFWRGIKRTTDTTPIPEDDGWVYEDDYGNLSGDDYGNLINFDVEHYSLK